MDFLEWTVHVSGYVDLIINGADITLYTIACKFVVHINMVILKITFNFKVIFAIDKHRCFQIRVLLDIDGFYINIQAYLIAQP